MVEGRSSSVRSSVARQVRDNTLTLTRRTFLDSDLGCAGLWLFLGRRVLVLLHAPYLRGISIVYHRGQLPALL